MEEIEQYKQLALSLKDQGNIAFQNNEIINAIDLYTQAIDLDPDNYLFYSNRSAAYMKSDSISKALKDAEKCVELAPNWGKGYSRLGAAQQALRRFQPAIDSFRKSIELEPNNKSYWSSLRAAEEAYEADKKIRFAVAAQERIIEEERLRQKDEEKRKAAEALEAKKNLQNEDDLMNDFLNSLPSTSTTTSSTSTPTSTITSTITPTTTTATTTESIQNNEEEKEGEETSPADEDLLEGFFSEINEAKKEKERKQEVEENIKHSQLLTEKYSNQDLGTARQQYERLTCKHYQFKNQNPYYVLQLDIDATMEDIKTRYRKLSAKVHPDKLRDVEDSRLAFEEVKDAYQKLCDDTQRDTIIMNIEFVRKEVMKERKKLISKGINESDLPPLEEQFEKRTMKHFADMYLNRKKSEQNLHAHNSREKMFEDKEKEEMEKFEEFEKEWSEIDRREKRVGSWRDFQVAPDAKKVKASSYKEETRQVEKHGVIQLETWKKNWK